MVFIGNSQLNNKLIKMTKAFKEFQRIGEMVIIPILLVLFLGGFLFFALVARDAPKHS